MRGPRADHVVCGRVVTHVTPSGPRLVEAIGIAEGRVVSAGARRDVIDAARPGARLTDAGEAAVIPGLHDSHLHLVGLARARLQVALGDAADGAEIAARVRAALAARRASEWVTGRGWTEAQLAMTGTAVLDEAAGERLVLLTSHDGHSAWASRAARRLAGIGEGYSDPAGGRIERHASGEPNGVLRETAVDLLAHVVPEVQGDALAPALDATLRELAGLGITGATEAGDYTDAGGIGSYAALGDSFSSLVDHAESIDGRLRLAIGIPAVALPAATMLGLRTGAPIDARRTLRAGWAKVYSDGALGSGTAALDQPATCGRGDVGILRIPREQLSDLAHRANSVGLRLAVHAIGDRAVGTVLDALAAAPSPAHGGPRHRVEHVQLLRRNDAPRFAALGVMASIQPIHAAADRDLVEACWAGRQERAYAWRTLVDGGVRLAAGSDAPVESVDPWIGLFAALHRRLPGDARGDWRPDQALGLPEALAAYTAGPALAIGASDEGHLRPGAVADVVVLDGGLEALLGGDERLARIRSSLSLVGGHEVPRS